jgi:hypothetical protein
VRADKRRVRRVVAQAAPDRRKLSADPVDQLKREPHTLPVGQGDNSRNSPDWNVLADRRDRIVEKRHEARQLVADPEPEALRRLV